MNKATTGALAALATLALATSAQAQICAGYPSSDRGFYFGARADFPEDIDSYGVEANYNFSGPLGVYGGLNVISAEDESEGDESLDEVFAGIALEAPSIGLMIGPRVSACAVGELRNISDDGDSYTEIPLGLGIGADLGLPVGPSVAGYVQPQVVFSRFDSDDEDFEADNETNFGVKAGIMAGFGLFTVGGEVRHLFLDENEDLTSVIRDETTFGIRVGIRI